MKVRSKVFAAMALGGAVALGGAATAYAAGSLNLRTSNANEGRFDGSWEFYPQGTGHGGFHVWGWTCDTGNDGNTVYSEGRVEGYGWSSDVTDNYGGSCAWENREFYDPAANRVGRGQYQVCVDDWGSDTCGTSQWYYR